MMSFLAKRNISINWFFFNQLPESLIESTSNYIILKYQKSVISSAGGGAINYDIKTEPLIIDKQLLDYINSSYKYTEVIKTFGESMEPDIKDGSLIFLDKSKKEIDSINIYNDKVYLKSQNQAYNDIWFKIDEVDIVGRVCGVLFKL